MDQFCANFITTGHTHKPNVDFASDISFDYNFKDSFLWNLIMKSCSYGDEQKNAFHLFVLMLFREVLLDENLISLVLESCSRLSFFRHTDVEFFMHTDADS